MDDEVKQLLAELNDNIRTLSARTAGNVKDLQEYDKAVQGTTRATTGLTEAEIARLEAQKKLKESEMHLKDANQKAKDALGQFGGALLDSTVKLSNFGKGIGTAGDAALALGNAFGGVAKVLGMVTKGATMLLEAQLKVTESYLNAKNQLNQLGGAGTHTTDSIREMARSADLNAETLGRMIKPLQGMGSSIMGLGSTAGAAQKNFAELMKATSEERMMMQRLGIDQEAMMQGTADYLQLQASSGRALKNELQDKDKLRRASIDYQTQLLDLAALTGKDVKSLKEQQKEQLMNRQMQLRNMQDQLKANRLREAGDEKGALALEKEIKTRNDSMQALAGSPKALQDGIRELMTTGAITGENAQALSMLGMQDAVQEYQKTVREGGDATIAAQKLQAEYVKKYGDRVESSGRQMAINENIQNRYGKMTQEELAWMGNRMGLSKEEAAKNAQQQKENREAAMKAGKDGAADTQAIAQEGVIKATGAMEDVIMKMPILGTAAIAAAAALGTIVVAARGAGGLGKLLGKGAAAAGPIASTVATGAGGAAAGGAGAAAGGLGKMLGTGARVLGKVAAPLAIGMSAYDAYKGFTADDSASMGDKLKNAGSSALHGLSFGMLGSSPEEIAARKKQQEATKDGGGVPDKSATDKMVEFSKLDIDAAKVKKNAEAFAVFSQAMSQYKPFDATALEQLSMPGLADMPVAQMQKFAAVDLKESGVKAVKNNAEAFTAFSNAMASYKGTGNQGMWTTLSEGVAGFFQIQPPYAGMESFSKINLGDGGVKRVKDNAQAFVYFGQALSQYKGTSELSNAADNIVGGLVKMFGGDDVIGKFVKFTKLDVDPDKALKLGQAFAAYTSALGMARGGGGGAAGGGAGAGAGGGAAAPAGGGGAAGGGTAAPAPAGGGGGGGGGGAGGGGILSRIGAALGIGGGGGGPSGPTPETDPDAKDEAGGSPKLTSAKPKNVTLGPSADVTGVQGPLLSKFYSAAAEFGKPITINSAYRGDQKQAELWVRGRLLGDPGVHMPAAPKETTTITYKGKEYTVQGSGKGSKHRNGQAIDMSTDRAAFDPILAKYGLHRPFPNDPPHVEIKAADGGMASGPETGYPATLHGNEMIVPLDPNSMLAELGKKSATEISTQIEQKTSQIQGMDPEVFKELASINQAMMDMMATKLDAVINKLESSNSTQSKILKYSKV